MGRAKTARKRPAKGGRVGSKFDALMKETGDYAAVTATTQKRVRAWRVGQPRNQGAAEGDVAVGALRDGTKD